MSTPISEPLSQPTAADSELQEIARRLFWWTTPAEALRDSRRFIAQVMALGTWNDVVTARTHFGDAALLDVLKNAPPGVFDVRSWHYWHHVFGIAPVPDLPKRRLA